MFTSLIDKKHSVETTITDSRKAFVGRGKGQISGGIYYDLRYIEMAYDNGFVHPGVNTYLYHLKDQEEYARRFITCLGLTNLDPDDWKTVFQSQLFVSDLPATPFWEDDTVRVSHPSVELSAGSENAHCPFTESPSNFDNITRHGRTHSIKRSPNNLKNLYHLVRFKDSDPGERIRVITLENGLIP